MNELSLESLAQRIEALERAIKMTPPATQQLKESSRNETPEVVETATPSLTEDEAARRIKAAKSLEEAFGILRAAPPWPDDYDILKALADNRRWSAGLPSLLETGENQ